MQKLENKIKSNFNKITQNTIEIQCNKSLAVGVLIAAIFLLPELSFAAGDAFQDILTKAGGWVNGSAGKLITFISLAMAGIMGVAGFPTKYVVGSLGTGLLLSSANGIVDMIF